MGQLMESGPRPGRSEEVFGCDTPIFRLPPPPQDGGKGGSITVTDMQSRSLVIAIAGCGGDGCPGDDGTCDPMTGMVTDGMDGGAGGDGGSIEILKGDVKGQDELYLWAGDGGKGGKGGDGGICGTTTTSSVSISLLATFGQVGNGGKGGNSGMGGDITIRQTGAIFGNLQAGFGGGGKEPTAGGDGDFAGNGGAGGKGGSLKLVKLTIGATLIGQAGPGGDGGNGGTGLSKDGTPGRGGDGGDIFHSGIKDLSRLKPPAFQPGTAGTGTPLPPGTPPPPIPPPRSDTRSGAVHSSDRMRLRMTLKSVRSVAVVVGVGVLAAVCILRFSRRDKPGRNEPSPKKPEVFVAPPSAGIPPLPEAAREGRKITFRVTTLRGARPLEGATVTAKGGSLRWSGRTDTGGMTFLAVRDGCDRLQVFVLYGRTPVLEKSVALEISAREQTVDLVVDLGPLLAVRTVDEANAPVGNVRVSAVIQSSDESPDNRNRPDRNLGGTTDAAGRWEALLPSLTLKDTLYLSASKDSMEMVGGRHVVALDQTTSDLEKVIVLRGKPQVRGRILGKDGTPLAGSKLTVAGIRRFGPTGEALAVGGVAGNSDSEGRFRMDVPQSGMDLFLAVRAEGHRLNVFHLNEGASEEPTFRLAEGSVVQGRLVDEQSHPQGGYLIRFLRRGIDDDLLLRYLGVEHEVRSGPDGTFKAFLDPTGTYSVHVAQGKEPQNITVGDELKGNATLHTIVIGKD